jgi:hypothetical protein
MIDDSQANVSRGEAIDLLDTPDKNPPVFCDDTHPCEEQFGLNGGHSDVTCRNSVCNDPLKVPPTKVPFNTGASGVSIRVVFNKLLDRTLIEDISTTDGITPGMEKTYALKDGVIDLLGPDGMPATDPANAPCAMGNTCEKMWDPDGAPDFTSDPVLEPFGPALQITPSAGLLPNTNYTIVVHSAMVKDRSGNPVSDPKGMPVSGDYSISFTTEAVAADITAGSFGGRLPGDFTPRNGAPTVTMLPNDILKLAFSQKIDASTFQFTLTGPVGTSQAYAYADTSTKPDKTDMTKCTVSKTTIAIAPVSAPSMLTNWPEGNYTLTFKVDTAGQTPNTTFSSVNWPGADASGTLTFVVQGPASSDPTKDSLALQNHQPAEVCTPKMPMM